MKVADGREGGDSPSRLKGRRTGLPSLADRVSYPVVMRLQNV
jgi:hypothetical protein